MMENKEILSEVLKRADAIRDEQTRKKRRIYASLSLAASFIFMISLSFAMPSIMGTIDTSTLLNNADTGTVFASTPYLGYIIIGIIAFILGVIVTIICYKTKDNERD